MDKLERILIENNVQKNTIEVHHRTMEYTKPHWHNFYEIELYFDGNGTMNINGEDYPIEPGTIFFLTPSDFHSHKSDTKLSLVNLSFSSSCIETTGFSNHLSQTECIACKLDKNSVDHISYLINIIDKELNQEMYLSKPYTTHTLILILLELFRLNNKNTYSTNQMNTSMQNILYYVRAHFKEPITLEDIADYTNLSTGYISKMFKKHLDCGFKLFLTDLRLSHAENLLLNSSVSISDIAYFCGFSSLSHFLNTFKKKYNMSPRNFRKNNENKKQL